MLDIKHVSMILVEVIGNGLGVHVPIVSVRNVSFKARFC